MLTDSPNCISDNLLAIAIAAYLLSKQNKKNMFVSSLIVALASRTGNESSWLQSERQKKKPQHGLTKTVVFLFVFL